MTTHQVTITLPEEIYRKVKEQSQLMEWSVETEVAAVVISSYQEQDKLSPDMKRQLSELKFFTDEELWQAARMTAPPEKEERMQELMDKQDLEELTSSEQQEVETISDYYSRIMLIRAEAAVLLKERGYDVDQLLVSTATFK
jgi:hypothetical protein